jgi:hypothetical protein
MGIRVGVTVGATVGGRALIEGAEAAIWRVAVGVGASVCVGEGCGVGVGEMETQLVVIRTTRRFSKKQIRCITF